MEDNMGEKNRKNHLKKYKKIETEINLITIIIMKISSDLI